MPNRPNEQERAAFEVFARQQAWSLERNAAGAYVNGQTVTGWAAWLARAAVAAQTTGEPSPASPLKLPQAWSDAIPGQGQG
jgi:hypothetical protein